MVHPKEYELMKKAKELRAEQFGNSMAYSNSNLYERLEEEEEVIACFYDFVEEIMIDKFDYPEYDEEEKEKAWPKNWDTVNETLILTDREEGITNDCEIFLYENPYLEENGFREELSKVANVATILVYYYNSNEIPFMHFAASYLKNGMPELMTLDINKQF